MKDVPDSLKRLILADDHTIVRAGLRNALAGLEVNVPEEGTSKKIEIVAEVGNGQDLWAALAQIPLDMIVMDVQMPGFEPLAAVQQIKTRYPHIKILVVSAFADETYVVGLLKAGVNGYHLKDQPLADLQLAVRRILQGERWITSTLFVQLTHHPVFATPVPSATWLTRRQRDLLRLLAQGADNRNIAQELEISVKTVENHLTALYKILGVDSRLKAMNYALQHPEVLAASGQAHQEMHSASQRTPGLAILVVDDNPRYRKQLSHLIGRIAPSVSIYEADNTADALRIGEKVQPRLGLIDVVLENEDGILCAHRLKNLSPATRLVMISAYPDREFRRRALAAGAIAFLDKKDLDTASVRQVVEDALR